MHCLSSDSTDTVTHEKSTFKSSHQASPNSPKRRTTMAHLRAQARKFAFGESTDSLNSVSTGQHSNTSTPSIFSNPGMIRQGSNISQLSCDCLDKPANSIIPRRTGHVDILTRDRPVKDFVHALQTDGCVIVKPLVNPQISQRVHTAHDQSATEEDETSTPVDITSFIRESFESDPLFDSISAYFLSLETVSWEGKQAKTIITRPHVYSSRSRNTDQLPESGSFNRADSTLHLRHVAVNRYYEHNVNRDALVGLFVPDAPSRNGSRSSTVNIQVIPGSQLWNDQKPDLSRGTVTVDLQDGDALILLGSLYHSVSAGRRVQRSPSQDLTEASKQLTQNASANLLHEVWTTSGIYKTA